MAESNPEDTSPTRPGASLFRRQSVRMIWILILAVAGYWTFGFFIQRWVLYPRHMAVLVPEIPAGLNAERVKLPMDFGQAEAWWIRPPAGDDGQPRPAPLLIYAHGNGETIDTALYMTEFHIENGFGVLAIEYPGYGGVDGRPGQDRIVRTFEAFLNWALEQPEVDANRIVYQGFSLGGAVVVQLSAIRPPAAMVLDSTFTSVRSMAARALVPGFIIRDPFDSLALAPRIESPVLLVHAEDDQTIPVRHSRRLAEAFPAAELLVVSGRHGGASLDQRVRPRLQEFLDEHVGPLPRVIGR
ncbi:MAG: alpha/beta hydrolase [Phycisphaeraceae bacterium]|nr:alpha/beta hydrolase [Phycisphaeraceae bacterium]